MYFTVPPPVPRPVRVHPLQRAAPPDIDTDGQKTSANQRPRAGRSLEEGGRVVLTVARVPLPEPPPIPPPPGEGGTGNGTGGAGSGCDDSYPSTCIPAYPPDLDCPQVSATNFSVVGGGPHGFDGDNDGVGCET